MSSFCCEFICLDKKESEKSNFTTSRVITLILASILILVIILCCICRFKHIKKEVDKQLKKMKSKRSQPQPAEEANANITFTEDLYVQMSVETINRNSMIDELKSKICVLEDKLDNSGGNSNGSSLRTSQHILSKNDESWKNLYDLHVDIKEDSNSKH
jgi:flagellar basal body-associated protein FliL